MSVVVGRGVEEGVNWFRTGRSRYSVGRLDSIKRERTRHADVGEANLHCTLLANNEV